MAGAYLDAAGVAPVRTGDGLGRLLAGNLRPKERLSVLKELSTALWTRGRDLSGLTDRAAQVLEASVARLPIRDLHALHAQYGADNEEIAERLTEESAKLADWAWTTAAILPAPPPAVHTLKVLVHSAIEIRLIAELYTVYGDPRSTRDRAWLNMVVHAWAAGYPVAAGPSTVVGVRDIAVKIRQSYTGLVSDDSRVSRVMHRGRDGGAAVRGLAGRYRRRMRFDPSTWSQPAAASTTAVVTSAVIGAARTRLGIPASGIANEAARSASVPWRELDDARAQHTKARSIADTLVTDAGNVAVLARLTIALDAQDQHLHRLAEQLHRSLPSMASVPTQRPTGNLTDLPDNPDALVEAHAAAAQADEAIDRVEDVGARSRRLSGWSPQARNSIVYAVTALVFSAPLAWVVAASDTRFTLGAVALLFLTGCVLPLLGYGIALLAVGRLFRSWLGGPAPRSPILGLLISVLIPSLVAAALAFVALV